MSAAELPPLDPESILIRRITSIRLELLYVKFDRNCERPAQNLRVSGIKLKGWNASSIVKNQPPPAFSS